MKMDWWKIDNNIQVGTARGWMGRTVLWGADTVDGTLVPLVSAYLFVPATPLPMVAICDQPFSKWEDAAAWVQNAADCVIKKQPIPNLWEGAVVGFDNPLFTNDLLTEGKLVPPNTLDR